MLDKSKIYTVEGTVAKCLPSAKFQIEIDDAKQIIAHLSGKIRKNKIRVSLGDRVTVEQDNLNSAIGRIVFRLKK